MLLLYEVVESKASRDREAELNQQMRDARLENKYHLVQNYNNDLIRRSLKSQNNHNRINIKEPKANKHFENITRKIEEKNIKKIAQMIGRSGHNQMKSLGIQKKKDEFATENDNQSGSIDKSCFKKERNSTFSNHGHTVSSNTTPHNNVSFSTNKTSSHKERLADHVHKDNPNKLLIKNSLIQRLKKRNNSKASETFNRASFSKEAHSTKQQKPAKPAELKISHKAEDRILHLTLTGAKHNTNLVQINNYINKLHREDSESLGVPDTRCHRQSANSNSSNMYSNKSKASKKPESQASKDNDMKMYANKLRKETTNPLKPQAKLAMAQPVMANIQNKNVLTLTQNLLQKRTRHE